MTSYNIWRGHALRTMIGTIGLAILLLAGIADAAIWIVDDSGGANYTKIQDAIDNASVGDTILVYSGTYFENVNVNKPLKLRGIDNGGGKPVINAGGVGSGSAITLSAGNSTLEGFEAVNASPNGLPSYIAGIRVNSNNNIIRDNNASNNYHSIYLQSSNYNTLIGNNASNNFEGIYLESSSNNLLSNNSITINGFGIYLMDSNYNTLNSNNALDNTEGIHLYSASNNNLVGNNASHNYYHGIGIVFYSSNNILIGNNASNNGYYGIYLSYYSSNNNKLSGNTASNNRYSISLMDSSYNEIEDNNASNNEYGIILESDSDNNLIKNNTALNNFRGISLNYRSNYNVLSNNNASNNSNFGLNLYNSNNNTLISNNALNNSYGIYLEDSSDNTISNNNVLTNNQGIYLLYSSSNLLTRNTANSNNNCGICLYSYMDFSSKNNILSDNSALNNNYGIYLFATSSNIIYNNYFNNIIDAWDNGNNTWNITKTAGTNIIGGSYLGGNYWSDYAGVDNDRDGLGDTLLPYNSSGNIINGGDFLPLTIASTPTASSISGFKINDTNGNGRWDAGEKGISNWTIKLIGITGKGKDTKIIRKETFTDAMGLYKFDNLSEGRYFVIEKLKKGFVPTSSPVKRIKLDQGKNSMNNNFTNRPVHSQDKKNDNRDIDDYEVINREIDKYKEDMAWN